MAYYTLKNHKKLLQAPKIGKIMPKTSSLTRMEEQLKWQSHQDQQGSGALLVRLYKDAGAPSIECSLTKFREALKSLSLGILSEV